MGSCCSSTASSDHVTEKLDRQRQCSSTAARRPRSPPPIMEEETIVKEVLSVSETPLPKKAGDEEKPDRRFHEEEEIKRGVNGGSKPIFLPTAEEISEICSLNESLSTTATNFTNDNENDETTTNFARVYSHRSPLKLPKNRSLSGELSAAAAARRDQRVPGGKSPARRSENSPGRRFGSGVGSVRIVQPRNVESGRVGSVRESARRDPGEGSARRSRSPAMRSGVGRSPSARRSGRSPGRVAGVSEDPNWPAMKKKKRVDSNDDGLNDESLDNPLVSLECFIFL